MNASPGAGRIPLHTPLLRGERRPRVALVGRQQTGKSSIFQAASSAMPTHARLAGEGAVRADARAAGNAHAGRHGRVGTDEDVVREVLSDLLDADGLAAQQFFDARAFLLEFGKLATAEPALALNLDRHRIDELVVD